MQDNLLEAEIGPGDWQSIIAHRLASNRGMKEPGGNEWYEAAEAGDALSKAGYILTKKRS